MRTVLRTIIEHGRAAEWLSSTVMLSFGLTLTLPGDTMAGTGYAAFRQVGLEEVSLAVPLVLVASGRMAALYINGRWEPGTPILRRWGAQFGAVLFALMGMAFGFPYAAEAADHVVTWWAGGGWVAMDRGPPAAAGTYMALALADVVAVYRASVDKGRAVARVA